MNTPTVPQSRTESVAAESATIPRSRQTSIAESTSGSQSGQRRSNPLSVRRYAQVVRKTAWRLTNTVREATSDGSLGAVEISRLHIWVTADLVPWALESIEHVDDTAKRQAMGLVDDIKRLDAELSASIGAPAAEIAEQLRRTGSMIVGILVKAE